MSLFTAAELEELRRADAEIDAEFCQTAEEIAESRARDRDARLAALPDAKRKRAEYQRAYYEANRDKVAERQRAYREANRDKVAERQRAYREANRDKVAEYQRAYYEANRDKVAERQRAYYEANRDKVAEYQRAYYEANRDKVAERQRAYYYSRTQNEAFRLWMQETGTTQRALAEQVGVAQGTISMWYTGSAPINMQKLRAALPELADYLEGAQ